MPRTRLLLTAALCLLPLAAAPAGAASDKPVPLPAAPADPDAAAIANVLAASRSDRAELRANAVEAIQHAPDRALPLVQAALEDPNPGVRFAALYVVGRQEMRGLAPAVRDLLGKTDEPNRSVRAATVFAAARLGLTDDAGLSEMARYLFDDDPRTRANAVLLMGELGQPGAAMMLRHAAARPADDRHPQIDWAILRLSIAEALAKIGDAPPDPNAVAPDAAAETAGVGLRSVRAATYSSFDEVRVLAVQALGRLKDDAFWGNLNNFLNPDEPQPIELRLAAAEALGDMDRGGNLLWAVLPATQSDLPTVRAQSAFALGGMQQPEARRTLARLLADPEEPVRVAAAAAWLEASR